ncbi:hypothetical protein MJO29_011952 [Puccinia striiformis f. sp. tritici]|nr:hypothetical protein MJO29_011952 [Puccinia striiformis f. sp. tritici]
MYAHPELHLRGVPQPFSLPGLQNNAADWSETETNYQLVLAQAQGVDRPRQYRTRAVSQAVELRSPRPDYRPHIFACSLDNPVR